MEDEQQQDKTAYLLGEILASMGLYLLRFKGDDEEISFQHCTSGGMLHLRALNAAGDILYQVAGKDPGELADQLAMACLRDLSPDRLRELHHKPLNKPGQLQAVK